MAKVLHLTLMKDSISPQDAVPVTKNVNPVNASHMTHAGPLHPPATAPGRTEGGWVGQALLAQPYQVSFRLAVSTTTTTSLTHTILCAAAQSCLPLPLIQVAHAQFRCLCCWSPFIITTVGAELRFTSGPPVWGLFNDTCDHSSVCCTTFCARLDDSNFMP